MADYSIIADISNFIVDNLRQKMCPETIPSASNIEVASPADKDSDYVLGLYFYDIRQEENVALPGMVPVGRTKRVKSPKAYSLHYMLYVNASSQMGFKAIDIQKILGRAVQVVNDNTTVLPSRLQPWLDVDEPPILISPSQIALEDKVKIWQAINKPYQVGMFYKAAPVFLSSEIVIDSPRVVDASFGIHIADSDE